MIQNSGIYKLTVELVWMQPLRSTTRDLIKFLIKNKVYLSASVVPWRNFNIHGTFPFHKRFFIMEKSWIIKMIFTPGNQVLLNISQWKDLWTKHWSELSLWKHTFRTFIFKSLESIFFLFDKLVIWLVVFIICIWHICFMLFVTVRTPLEKINDLF